MALVGETRVTEMLANVFFPLAFAEDSSRWLGFKNLPAALTNRRVEIAAVRLFGPDSPRARHLLQSAAVQQGLLQVYEGLLPARCERLRSLSIPHSTGEMVIAPC
jgi:hypothetical protein